MDLSKIKKIFDVIAKILSFVSSLIIIKGSGKTNVEIRQDEQTNADLLNRINDNIRKKMTLIAVSTLIAFTTGCINFNFGLPSAHESKDKNKEKSNEVMLANPMNVYRTSTNVVIKAMVQNKKKNGWVESNTDVLIPSGWYIVSGVGLDDEEK